MKALLFTLDSIFSLTIAAVGISALLFFTYLAQVPYSIHSSNAQAILSELTSTSIDSAQNSSLLAKAMAVQFAGANQTSAQFLQGIQGDSSGTIGPTEPIVAYSFAPANGNAITTGVVADYGNFYFASNSLLYVVNATTNATVWTPKYAVTPIMTTPALYSGMLYYANMTNLTSVDARTFATIWSVNAISLIDTPILVYNNQVIVGTADSNMRAYSAYNGTLMWTTSASGVAKSVIMTKGNIDVATFANTMASITQTANSANLLTGSTYSVSNGPTNLASLGSVIYLGTGSSANAIKSNLLPASGNFPIAASNGIVGVSAYKSYVLYQTYNSVFAVSPSGSTYWRIATPPSFGIAVSNTIPVVTGGMVYTLWANGLAGQNLTTGAFQWFSLIPGGKIYPYMTLAYGRLYLIANNRIRAYGPCRVPIHASLLSAAATLDLNQQPGCAGALINSVYPMANYTVFAPNASSRTVMSASFSGIGNYISAKNSAQLNTSFVTVSFWMNMTALPGAGVRLVNYGDNTTCATTVACGWFFYLSSNSGVPVVQFDIGNNALAYSVNGPILSTNKWYHVVGSYNGSALSLIVNDGTPTNTPNVGAIGLTTPNINLVIGGSVQTPITYFTGNIANLQIYKNPLSARQISQLYLRGVQGMPITGAGLVGWYPLAGDANDYSMFDTGYVTGAAFVTKNYVSPALSGAFDVARSSIPLPLRNYTSWAVNTLTVGVYSWS